MNAIPRTLQEDLALDKGEVKFTLRAQPEGAPRADILLHRTAFDDEAVFEDSLFFGHEWARARAEAHRTVDLFFARLEALARRASQRRG